MLYTWLFGNTGFSGSKPRVFKQNSVWLVLSLCAISPCSPYQANALVDKRPHHSATHKTRTTCHKNGHVCASLNRQLHPALEPQLLGKVYAIMRVLSTQPRWGATYP